MTEEGWDFPRGTTLSARSSLDATEFGSGKPQALGIVLLAGFRYAGLEIEAPMGNEFGVEHVGATVMLVGKTTEREECHLLPSLAPMALTEETAGGPLVPSPLALGTTLRLFSANNRLFVFLSDPYLVFMEGGEHKLCYTPDGTFDGDEYRNAIVPVLISVIGVFSPCNTNGCLARERWHCYFSFRAELEGPCRVDFRTYGGGRTGWGVRSGAESKVAWTATWAEDRYFGGAFLPGPAEPCSDVLSGAPIVPDTSRFDPAALLPQVGLQADQQTAAALPALNKQVASSSFTLSLCYCPSYDSQVDAGPEACNHEAEFIQPIGSVHYWMLRLCDLENFMSCGVLGMPYARVLPHQPFVLRLQCPPGGVCVGGTGNRLRIIRTDDPLAEEKASWEPRTRCQTEPRELASIMWQQSNAGFVDQSGGTRRDYKVWHERYLVSTQPTGEAFDVCYCDSGCSELSNYIKVGRIQTVQSIGIAKLTQALATEEEMILKEPMHTVEYRGKAGALTLFGGGTSPLSEGLRPDDSVPFSRRSLLKLISYDREALYPDGAGTLTTLERASGLARMSDPAALRALDAACASGAYDPELVEGPSSVEAAKEFIASVHGGATDQRAPFSGPDNDRSMLVLKSGVLVVCYCAMLSEVDTCQEDDYWLHVARILVKGPRGDASLVLPTTFVVRVDLDGWGFSARDTLRFIGMTQACNENGYSPSSTDTYRIGCPGLNSTDCRLPTEKEDITVFVENANDTGIFIASIDIGDYNSTLTFTGDILGVLEDGDAITIEDRSVLLNGRDSSNWTAAERHTVSRLTGIYEYLDDPNSTRVLWNRVSPVYTYGELDARRLSLPVGWPESQRPLLSFVGGHGIWVRRNRLRTREELKAVTPVTMKICWATYDEGSQKYYSEAGTVNFREPPFMADAGVYLTAQVVGARAPVVISFSPKQSQTAYRDYEVPIVLRMLFRDTEGTLEPLLTGEPGPSLVPLDPEEEVPLAEATMGLCGKLFLEMWTNDAGGFPIPKGCYFSQQFQDMSSSEVPEPIYREYYIVFHARAGLKSVCFDYRFQRPGGCVYMLVLNARVGEGVRGGDQDLVSLHTMCANEPGAVAACGSRYSVIEYGAGTVPFATLPANAAEAQLGRVEVGQLRRHGAAGGSLELAAETVTDGNGVLGLEFRAWPLDAAQPIQRQAQLRVFFSPLSLWNIGFGPCTATCTPAPGYSCSDGRGGSQAECLQRPVVFTSYEAQVPMQKNSLLLTYPRYMDVLPGSASGAAHALEVEDLLLPDQGFFPLRFLAQLMDKDGNSPSVALTGGTVYRVPTGGTTSGRLLFDGQSGAGPRPFLGDKSNELIVRLTLGATLQHVVLETPATESIDPGNDNDTETESVEPSPDAASIAPPVIEILLPEGYTCSVVGDGTADPDGTQELFQRDADGDGYLDNYMGTLSAGAWSRRGRVCSYTLDPYAQVFAGQVFYARLSVDNPKRSLLRVDPANVWLLRVKGTGSATLGPPAPFISLAEELLYPGWVGNLAVLVPLEGESAQPANFTEGAMNDVSVFFTAVHSLPEQSYIVLDAPDGFDFGSECLVLDLDPALYADWRALAWGEDLTGPLAQTRNLGEAPNCTTDRWHRHVLAALPTANFTRARIRVTRRLLSGAAYGFRVRVQNPLHFTPTQQYNWRLWIQDPEGYPVDGSKETIQFNQARIETLPAQPSDRSWGIYEAPLLLPLALDFNVTSVLPSSVPLMSPLLTVFPLAVTRDGRLTSLRVLAPDGYEWDVHAPNGFSGFVPGLTRDICPILSRPEVPVPNELVLPELVLNIGCEYGFQVRISVPDRPPTRSANSFFFEIGHAALDEDRRLHAGVVPAPLLRVIHSARIVSLCNAAAFAANVVEFHLSTTSELRANDGFVFSGDELTRDTFLECFPSTVTGSLPLPRDAQCSVFKHEVTRLPVVILGATQHRMPAGSYGFRFAGVLNPLESRIGGGHWTVGTYGDVHLYPQLRVLDLASSVPSPRVIERMEDAGLMEPPTWLAGGLGRDNRPGVLNKLVFYFQLYEQPAFPRSVPTLTLALRGPTGFIFENHCLDGIRVLANAMNATNATNSSNISWPPCMRGAAQLEPWCPKAFEVWPQGLEPVDCIGIGSTAKILVPNPAFVKGSAAPVGPDLHANVTYAFQVAVTNPLVDERPAMWALDFGMEASKPFTSFALQTFDTEATVFRVVSVSVSSPFEVAGAGLPFAGFQPISVLFVPSVEVPAAQAAVGARRLQAAAPGGGALEGSLELQAPEGFTFAASASGVCRETLLERAGRERSDDAAVFHEGVEMLCTVPQPTVLVIRLQGSKPLEAGVAYRLLTLVKNPEETQYQEQWVLESYMRAVLSSMVVPIDRIVFPGFQVIPALREWLVENDSNELTGGMEVRQVRLSIRFTRELLNGDTIIVRTSTGVRFSDSGGACRDFRWSGVEPPGWLLPLPDSPPPTCACEAKTCELRLRVDEGPQGELAREADQELAFMIGAVNPTGQPDQADDFWTAEHRGADGALVASAVAGGWPVYGQLNDITMAIIGLDKRAGAASELIVGFTPAVWGSVLELVVHEPAGFDFSSCLGIAPLVPDSSKTLGNRLVLVGGDFAAGTPASASLSQVLLGPTGGQTRLSLRLYEDIGLRRQVGWRLNFLQGVRAPGNLQVVGQQLWSEAVVQHHEGGVYDAVLPLLPPHAGKLARVELLFHVTKRVPGGDYLIVRSETFDESTPFEPRIDGPFAPSIQSCKAGESGQECEEPVTELGFEHVRLLQSISSAPHGLNLTLNKTLAVEASPHLHRLRFWCLVNAGTLYWQLSTEDEGDLPTNTNDGVDRALGAVPEIDLSVELSSPRTPPASVVPVKLVIRTAGQDFDQLQLVLPRGHVRPGMQQPANAEDASRTVLSVGKAAGVGDPRTDGGWTLNMKLVTPRYNVSDTRWLVYASREGWGGQALTDTQMLGWGVAAGFFVASLPVRLAYPGIPLFTGWVACSFALPTIVRARFALVSAPLGFQVTCPPGVNKPPLQCLPFDGSQPGTGGIGVLERTANVTLPQPTVEGTNKLYSFLLGVSTPEYYGGSNSWAVRVLDADLQAVDSALNVSGREWQPGFFVQSPTISWGRPPQSGETSEVTVEVTFIQRVQRVQAILISLPERYRHDIQHPNQFKSENRNLPLAVEVEWRNYDSKRWVRILLATGTVGTLDFVPAGTFQFKLPVMVPMEQPSTDEWYVSLCATFGCENPDSPDIRATFPMPNRQSVLPPKIFAAGTVALTAAARGPALGAAWLWSLALLRCGLVL